MVAAARQPAWPAWADERAPRPCTLLSSSIPSGDALEGLGFEIRVVRSKATNSFYARGEAGTEHEHAPRGEVKAEGTWRA